MWFLKGEQTGQDTAPLNLLYTCALREGVVHAINCHFSCVIFFLFSKNGEFMSTVNFFYGEKREVQIIFDIISK